jgi:hypothetical protein
MSWGKIFWEDPEGSLQLLRVFPRLLSPGKGPLRKDLSEAVKKTRGTF